MCGFTGVFYTNTNKEVNSENLVKMRDTMIHRGPDDKGLFISENKKIGFGFRRLSIIDLSSEANEPILNEDGNLILVFNGEIYNFKEIKEKLIASGHKFKSQTDAEVILHLYEEKKEKLLEDLNGMFAFVLYDQKENKLFCSRDRLGIKPFYYYFKDGVFLFGSEIKSILQYDGFKKELNLEAVAHYLDFLCTPAPLTLFKNVYKLGAGMFMILENNQLKTEKYWHPLIKMNEYMNQSESFYILKTKELLEDSIKQQMVSDVPFGCFLSGGIDSSANAILMSRALGKPVKTFTSFYEDAEDYNEIKQARKIVKLLGSENYEIKLSKQDFLSWLPEFAENADDPNGDPVSFPIYYLSKLAREHGVIMVQVGEGSDEIFCGYKSYWYYAKLWKIFWRYSKNLPLIKSLPYVIVNTLFSPSKKGIQIELLRRLAHNKPLFFGGAHGFYTYEKNSLFTDKFKHLVKLENSDDITQKYYDELRKINPKADFTMQMLYIELNLRLPELLLMRVDKMSMANSIETRVPFLDHRLVELASLIPMKFKIKNDETKHILKKALVGIVPEKIIHRKKQGFHAPIKEWLRPQKENDVSEKLISIIRNSKLQDLGILNYKYVEQMIKDHQYGDRDYSLKLYNLITLSLWYDYWFK